MIRKWCGLRTRKSSTYSFPRRLRMKAMRFTARQVTSRVSLLSRIHIVMFVAEWDYRKDIHRVSLSEWRMEFKRRCCNVWYSRRIPPGFASPSDAFHSAPLYSNTSVFSVIDSFHFACLWRTAFPRLIFVERKHFPFSLFLISIRRRDEERAKRNFVCSMKRELPLPVFLIKGFSLNFSLNLLWNFWDENAFRGAIWGLKGWKIICW